MKYFVLVLFLLSIVFYFTKVSFLCLSSCAHLRGDGVCNPLRPRLKRLPPCLRYNCSWILSRSRVLIQNRSMIRQKTLHARSWQELRPNFLSQWDLKYLEFIFFVSYSDILLYKNVLLFCYFAVMLA